MLGRVFGVQKRAGGDRRQEDQGEIKELRRNWSSPGPPLILLAPPHRLFRGLYMLKGLILWIRTSKAIEEPIGPSHVCRPQKRPIDKKPIGSFESL